MNHENRMLPLLLSGASGVSANPAFSWFGQFVGSWDLEATFYEDEGESHVSGEWHFDWILQGRAIQDVLIFPALESASDVPGPDHRMGTSVRFFDEEAGLWRVVWINPSSGTMYKLTGGKEGEEIVLSGDQHDGEPTKWIFSNIADDSFLWRGLVAEDGKTWQLIQQMHAKRRKAKNVETA